MKVAIIGAGMGGMAAAYDLIRSGHAVTIFESVDHVGGLASGFKEPHWSWSVENFYHHFFESDHAMKQLIHELGWEEDLLYFRPLTVMYHRGKFSPFDSIVKALLYPGLGFGLNKLRFGLVGLFLKLTNNWKPLEKTTVNAWLRKWAGDRVYEMMWEPLMTGKFGERYANQVNMAWMWARIKARTTRLGTFRGGFQELSNRFADRLRSMGVEILLSSPVSRIARHPEGGLVLETVTGPQQFDQCLVTTSPALLAQLAPGLPQDYLQGLLSLKSMGAVVLVLSLDRQLSKEGYYWYNIPKSAGFPFLALVEHTNFVSPENFGGDHIIYIGDYLETDHEHFSLGKDELLKRFLPALTRFNSDFNPGWIKKTWLFRTPYAQPIPEVNHSRNIPSISTPIPGLYLACMSQVYPWDRGTNYAVEIGRRAARTMMAEEKVTADFTL
ncbi:MAG: NAD(P)/FAD-dependent oxidoreductase [Chloroflexota bacterium]|nr:MAG: NAD(P)/FAD-dependent oxidoreductase [Chloroflexota bacterium]